VNIRVDDSRANTIVKKEVEEQNQQYSSEHSNQMAYNPQISKNLDYNIDRSLHDPRRNYVSKFSLRQDTYREEAKSDNIDHIESDDDEEANISQKMQSSHEQPKGIKHKVSSWISML